MAYILQIWMFFTVLLSSNGLDRWNTGWTEVTISASLKSEVFLPCHFDRSLNSETDTVKWTHNSDGAPLLRITNNGIIYFDRIDGRVSVFPLLFKEGNFSILIHDLEPSDIGPYFCERSGERWRVEILSEPPVEKTVENSYHNSLGFFFAGAGLFTLLCIVFYLTGLNNRCMKCMRSSIMSFINEEHDEAFRTPDPKDSTVWQRITYKTVSVNQA